MSPAAHSAVDGLDALLHARRDAYRAFYGAEAARVSELCHRMAERFARGGRLIAFGASAADRSDVRHVAVEFVHPVIVGKRALPAFGIGADEVGLVCGGEDIVMAFGEDEDERERGVLRAGVAAARAAGALTIAFAPVGAEWELRPGTDDPFVAQELVETTYHLLWELVHVFFEHRGLLEGRSAGAVHDTGASSFLYPFLAEAEDDLGAVLADVRASVLAKADEVGALRAQTLGEGGAVIAAATRALRTSLDGGGCVLALGNGGSATDAMDLVADLRHPPARSAGAPLLRPRRAVDLTEDPAILTAIANDVGHEAVFARQVIAYGRPGDVVVALSTSGGSANVLSALAEARRRGLVTIALVGYDGGRIAAEHLADHVVVTRSEHIPRIQEAQATVLHALRLLIEEPVP
ncbi:MAG TPA: SIS domain-containing protein [Baekduia sp.]|jgi:D-sedoheptulose 7-phosphate isomerase